MAAATKRIVVRVTPVHGIKRLNDEENIHALIQHVNASTKEASVALDDALSFVAASNERIAAMAGGRS